MGVDQCDPDGSAEWLRYDLTKTGEIADVFRNYSVSAVIHMAAALPSASRSNPRRATEVNIEAGVNLIETATTYGVESLVLASVP